METKSLPPMKQLRTAVDLAVAAALDGNPNPLDMDMRDIDPDPTSLDLVGSQKAETCPRPRRRDRAVCACGRLLPRS
jgi:hypothetical protein